MASTPWGEAAVLDEVVLRQRAGVRAFSTHVQLLETKSGDRLVRLAYATSARAWVRRGPVTFRIDDLERLRGQLAGHPELAAAFGLNGAQRRHPGASGPRRRTSPG